MSDKYDSDKIEKVKPRKRMPSSGIIATALFVVMLVYALSSIFYYFFTDKIRYYEVVEGTNTQDVNVSFTGLAIRDERIFNADEDGYVEYFVKEGSRVSKNTTLYSIDSTGELMKYLKEAGKADKNALTSENIKALSNQLDEYTNRYNDMNFNDVYDFKNSLKGMVIDLVNMNTLTGMAKEAGDDFVIKKADETGIVLYKFDGYEDVTVDGLNSELYDRSGYNVSNYISGNKVIKGEPIYKVINDENWKIAIPLTREQAEGYADTSIVKIKFLKDGITCRADFSVESSGDGYYGIIALSKYMIRYAFERFIDIQILETPTKGYKIPKSSIVQRDYLKIPAELGFKSTNGDLLFIKKNGTGSTDTIHPTIVRYIANGNSYLIASGDQISPGDTLVYSDTNEEYVVGNPQPFDGVYNINSGYTIFLFADVLCESDEFVIVDETTSTSIHLYDRIVLDASMVDESQIVHQ